MIAGDFVMFRTNSALRLRYLVIAVFEEYVWLQPAAANRRTRPITANVHQVALYEEARK